MAQASVSTSQAPENLQAVRFPRGTTFRAVWALLMREVATNNARAFGGVLWAFLQPVLGILFLTAIFSAGFKTPPVGTNFALFYASGFLPFTMYVTLSSQLGTAVQGNRRLLTFPRITLLDALLARVIFVVLVQLIVTVTLYMLILSIWDTKAHIVFAPLVLSLCLAIVLGIGIGCLNAYLFAIFPTYKLVWSIVTQPLFLVSCVIFPYSAIPRPFDQWLWWNPLVHVVELSRSGFYHRYDIHHVEVLYPLGLGAVACILGLVFLNQGRGRLLRR